MMKRFSPATVVILLCSASLPSVARAQTAMVVREVIEQAADQVCRQTGREGIEQLAAIGGRTAVRDVLEQSAREGGEQLVQKVTQVGVKEGPSALRAIGNSPARLVAALDASPAPLRSAALHALEREPQMLTKLVTRYGPGALEVAAEHPGVGEKLVQTLGTDGVQLGRGLTTDQAILATRHVDEIAALAPAERSSVVQAILRSPTAVLDYLESHPRTLRTAAGVAIVCAVKNQILGDPGASKVLADGTVVTTPAHPGLIERALPAAMKGLQLPLGAIGAALGAGLLCWMLLHLWGKWRLVRLRIALQQAAARR